MVTFAYIQHKKKSSIKNVGRYKVRPIDPMDVCGMFFFHHQQLSTSKPIQTTQRFVDFFRVSFRGKRGVGARYIAALRTIILSIVSTLSPLLWTLAILGPSLHQHRGGKSTLKTKISMENGPGLKIYFGGFSNVMLIFGGGVYHKCHL